MRNIILLSLIIIITAVLAITVSYIFVYMYPTSFVDSILSHDSTPHIVENSYVRLSTDKSTYSKGEPVVFTIKNNSPYDFSSSANYGMNIHDMHGNYYSYDCPTCTTISKISANSSFTDTWQPNPNASGTIQVCNNLYSYSAEYDYHHFSTLCSFIIINDD